MSLSPQAENCPEPLEIYRYMQAQRIGVTQASFYIAWSEEYERLGNSLRADNIYQEGFNNFAEPRDKLQQFHKYVSLYPTQLTGHAYVGV